MILKFIFIIGGAAAPAGGEPVDAAGAAQLPSFSANGAADCAAPEIEAVADLSLPSLTSACDAEFTAIEEPWSLDLTSAEGMFQDTGGTVPVTRHGQDVRRIETAGFAATWTSGTATWQTGGLEVGGGARWQIDGTRKVAGMVVACTPSAGDTSPNHGIVGSASEYVTIGNGAYRWRLADNTRSMSVPDATFPMQVASFAATDTDLSLWMNGIPAGTQPGKGALTTIDRLFHRSRSVTYEGTLAYLALSPEPYSDAERERLQSRASLAAAKSWPVGERKVFTPAGVPLITEILGTDDPAKPLLISHHGLGAKSDGDVYNASNFARSFGVQVFSPWFDNRFTSSDYQKGRQSWLEAPLVEAFRAHLRQPGKPVLIYGHSAGGQWVSRVAAYDPPRNVQRFVPANPSTWVFPDDRAYPYGFGHIAAGKERDKAIAAYLRQPLTVYIGEADNDPDDSDLDKSTDAMRQGRHRYERARNVFETGKAAAARLGVPFNWSFVVASRVGHAGTAMLNSSDRARAFFPG